jgi:hypothetical protein
MCELVNVYPAELAWALHSAIAERFYLPPLSAAAELPHEIGMIVTAFL